MDTESLFSIFQKIINYNFNNINLLLEALTHKSFSSENSDKMHNEHLEFLGDAVLNLIISAEIYKRLHRESDEGLMTKIRSSLVKKEILAQKAKKLNLCDFIMLGKGEENSNGRKKDRILANVFEALIGAIFIDGGFDKSKEFLLNIFNDELNDLKVPDDDYKSLIQDYFQKKYHKKPIYQMEEISNRETFFKATLYLDNKSISSGMGKNKKSAQKEAAKRALEVLTK